MPEPTTLPAATMIKAAPKSIFESYWVTALGKSAPIVKDIILPLMKLFIEGVTESEEQKKLREIYGKLNLVDAKIDGLAATANYLNGVHSVKQKITGIYMILQDKTMASLKDSELKELCDFLTPGIGATTYTNYKSCINNLLGVAYGVTLDEALNSTTENRCEMGRKDSQAEAINTTALSSSKDIVDYINMHLKFAGEIAAFTLAICLAANDAYKFLNDNREAIKKYFDTPRMGITLTDVEKTLEHKNVQADIANLTSKTFLSNRLRSTFETAASTLCGTAYHLFSAMSMNALKKDGAANTNISIWHEKGAIGSKTDSYFRNGIHMHDLEYRPGQAFWTASFSENNKVSSEINLAGPHGGFLGLMHDGSTTYVYEITGNVSNTPPAHEWKKCIWKLKVRHDKDRKMVFMFVNKEFDQRALANNHNFFISTQPGHSRLEEDNPDEYWTIKMFQSGTN